MPSARREPATQGRREEDIPNVSLFSGSVCGEGGVTCESGPARHAQRLRVRIRAREGLSLVPSAVGVDPRCADAKSVRLPRCPHATAPQGIEATVDADETLELPGADASALFDMWVNTCPGQGSRTIRTEEAVLITLARLRSHVLANRGSASGAAAGGAGAAGAGEG